MKTSRILIAISLGFAIGLVTEVTQDWGSPLGFNVSLTVGDAWAAPKGQTRRVARRTTRRTVRRLTRLPAGCIWRAPYHYCGGVYYQPVVDAGVTVYIVVYL